MARRTATPRATRRPAARTQLKPRDLLLAGVGAVSLGRKQALRTLEEAGRNAMALGQRLDAGLLAAEAQARKLRRQAEGDVARLRKQAEGKVAQLRKQARAQVAPLQKKLDTFVGEVRAEASKRLDPVLVRLGAKVAPVRRPAAKKAPRRARKAA